jgi:hypothetical protein
MCDSNGMEMPAAGGDDPEAAGDEAEAYEPRLPLEERAAVRCEWLAAIRPPAEGRRIGDVTC